MVLIGKKLNLFDVRNVAKFDHLIICCVRCTFSTRKFVEKEFQCEKANQKSIFLLSRLVKEEKGIPPKHR
jgi:hypothetical protein